MSKLPEPIVPDRPARWKSVLKVLGIVVLLALCAGGGVAYAVLNQFYGTENSPTAVFRTISAYRDPRRCFPGRNRITVLCLGLDRNIFVSRNPRLRHLVGMPYTKGARSDVMMVASLDLERGTAAVLSIPRDTRVVLPGKSSWAKINQAHADGGIPYTREAVEQFLGIPIDHHVVIKQEAIQQVVDALGGLRVKVEKDMKYDDNWGQLHIDLKAGEQVLTGEQVVGYLRFRHDAEGDLGRIRRQQQVIQTISEVVKSPTVLMKAPALVRAVRNYVQTDLSPEQQIALASLFHKLELGAVQTASLPIQGGETINRISYLVPDEERTELMVDWLLRGEETALNPLIQVQVKNASGDRKLYQSVLDCLRAYGFRVLVGGRAPGAPQATTRVVQHGTLKGTGRRVLESLAMRANVERSDEPGPDVVLYVGKDMATSLTLASRDLWPEPPEPRLTSRRARRPAPEVTEPVNVRVRSTPQDLPVEPEPPIDEPPPPDPVPQPDPIPEPPPTTPDP